MDDYVGARTSNSKVMTEQARQIYARVLKGRLQSAQPCPWTKIRGREFCLAQRWMPRDFPGLLIESGSVPVFDNNKSLEGLHVLGTEEAA
jgi:hypothetical protein